jgi:hypothetical protein
MYSMGIRSRHSDNTYVVTASASSALRLKNGMPDGAMGSSLNSPFGSPGTKFVGIFHKMQADPIGQRALIFRKARVAEIDSGQGLVRRFFRQIHRDGPALSMDLVAPDAPLFLENRLALRHTAVWGMALLVIKIEWHLAQDD